MTNQTRNVAILGSTGSIGSSTLDVVQANRDRFKVVALTAHTQLDLLCQQAQEHLPHWVIATDRGGFERYDWSHLPSATQVRVGEDQLCEMVQRAEVDIVLAAIVGIAGLTGAWAAVEAGKTVALANKETLVVAGPLVMDLAKRHGATILPVDSEHCAVFQCLHAGRRADAARVILTASGGPFRDHSAQQLANVTVDQALAHPTWDMGPKITIDSATMMNKAFEIVEARWLFDLEPDQIDVVVHPQSIVHSLVEFVDGSVMAQLGPPDMRLPIQFALTYPERWTGSATRLDLTEAMKLDFIPADPERFPALDLGHEVARIGGTTGAVVNAANEAAVARFLNRRLRFSEIVPACRAVLNNHNFDPSPTLDQLWQLDTWARQEVSRWAHS